MEGCVSVRSLSPGTFLLINDAAHTSSRFQKKLHCTRRSSLPLSTRIHRTSILLLDVAGAFDNAMMKGYLKNLFKWLISYVPNRAIKLTGGTATEGHFHDVPRILYTSF